jgi:hypothetical protein
MGAFLLLVGCNTEGCDQMPVLGSWLGGSLPTEALTPLEMERTERIFCTNYRGTDALFSGQSVAAPDPESPAPLPDLVQPHLSVTVNGETRHMNELILGELKADISKVDWPKTEECGEITVLSHRSVLQEYAGIVLDTLETNRKKKQAILETATISSVWQQGADDIWRVLQIHISTAETPVPYEGPDIEIARRGRSGGDVRGW